MKVVSFVHQGRQSFGATTAGGVIDLGARLRTADIGAALRRQHVEVLMDMAARHTADLPEATNSTPTARWWPIRARSSAPA
ncbi:hypothetical protein D8I24_2169 (plasmid) [Cupriavidus necator H850]|uniref:hypothetical protein n=1 Tax=Cupriavidus necator TaxID=106590 RepID=UPI00129D9F74|nr:hypothetical protein [Cupriavidus necator]KAI3605938.1 hypothetical protein D8I24_2169 [Cupriavidus necator H850]